LFFRVSHKHNRKPLFFRVSNKHNRKLCFLGYLINTTGKKTNFSVVFIRYSKKQRFPVVFIRYPKKQSFLLCLWDTLKNNVSCCVCFLEYLINTTGNFVFRASNKHNRKPLFFRVSNKHNGNFVFRAKKQSFLLCLLYTLKNKVYCCVYYIP
jgi:hypothetical protein